MRGRADGRDESGGHDVRLLVPALLAWVAGAATLGWSVDRRALLAAGALGTSVALARARGRPALAVLALTAAATALVLGSSAAQGAVRSASQLAQLAADGAVVRVEGSVASDPVRVSSHGLTTQSWLVRLTVRGVVARGIRRDVSATVLVLGGQAWSGLLWHEGVAVSGRLARADPAAAEAAQLFPLTDPLVTSPAGWAERAAERLRAGLRAATASLPADARGLLPGLVIGDTSATPQSLTDAMKATSMTHLCAVSGENVSLVLAAVLLVCRRTGVRARARPVIGILAVLGFVVLARPEPSVLRAAVMGSIGLAGRLGSRFRGGLPVLAGALLVLLTWDPWLARSFGFALSSLACLGLLVFVRPWGVAIDARMPARAHGIGELLAIPAAAQLMTAPLIVVLQGSVSVVGILANAIVAPLVGPATIAGVLAAAVGAVSVPVACVPAWAGGLPTEAIAWVARRFAAVPWGSVPWPKDARGAFTLAALLLGAVLTGRWWMGAVARSPVIGVLGVALAVLFLLPTRWLTWPPQGWEVVACDVGQGDAIAVRSGPSSALLVDAGPDPAAVVRCLVGLGVRSLDGIVLTHFHADHVDGLPAVLQRWPTAVVLVSPVADPPDRAERVATWARTRGIRLQPVWAGDTIRVGAVTAHVWWPARRVDSGSVPNNASVVLTVTAGSVDALLLGDVEREAGRQVLRELQTTPGAVPAGGFDVVKVAHHGSANGDPTLIDWARAPVALVSVGAGNTYGHPAPSTLTTLRRAGFIVWRTDQRGTVAVVDGPDGVGVSAER